MTNEEIYELIHVRINNSIHDYRIRKPFEYQSNERSIGIELECFSVLFITRGWSGELSVTISSILPEIQAILKDIIWKNRDHKTIVTTRTEKTYVPGKSIEYYLDGEG